ncbi:HupE/UreJ family protein [Acidobacteria bacterium AH-259-D05]|nr:HupE/UreJ family protein [Acidobacteria bacterium AH-259-D05]
MNVKPVLSIPRSLGILIAALGSQQMVFGHHAEVMQGHPLIQGLSMPLHGLDHMLMAIAVGIIAIQLGGRAVWIAPLGFSMVLLTGGLLNLGGISIPLLEQMILASLILAGLQLSLKNRLPAGIIVALFSLLGAFHGQALIQPVFGQTSLLDLLLFTIGCVFSALLLLFSGVGIGFFLKERTREKNLFRLAGAALLMSTLVISLVPEANGWLITIFEGLGTAIFS